MNCELRIKYCGLRTNELTSNSNTQHSGSSRERISLVLDFAWTLNGLPVVSPIPSPSSLSERKSEALTTAISTLKEGDHRSLLGLIRPSSGEFFGEKCSLRQAPSMRIRRFVMMSVRPSLILTLYISCASRL